MRIAVHIVVFAVQVYIPMTFTGGFEILSKPKRYYNCYCVKIRRCHQVTAVHTHSHHRNTLTSVCRVELMFVSMVSPAKLPAVLSGRYLVTCCLLGLSSSIASKCRLGWRTFSWTS